MILITSIMATAAAFGKTLMSATMTVVQSAGTRENQQRAQVTALSWAGCQAWSPLTGVFTRKQKHTITFRKVERPTIVTEPTGPGSGIVRVVVYDHGPTCGCEACHERRLGGKGRRR
jgi:hypothetical protein